MSCEYIYKRQNLCGKKCDQQICKKSKKYCSKHVYIEIKNIKEKKKSISKLAKESNSHIDIDDFIENKAGYLLIKNTNLVVNNKNDKVVIGKIKNFIIELEDCNIIENRFCRIDKEDIEICRQSNFLYKEFI